MSAPQRKNRRKTQDGRALRRKKRRWRGERLFAWLRNFHKLNQDGILSPRVGMRHKHTGWGSSTIRAMLHNERYIGIWKFKQRQWVKVPGANKRRPRKRDDSEVISRLMSMSRTRPMMCARATSSRMLNALLHALTTAAGWYWERDHMMAAGVGMATAGAFSIANQVAIDTYEAMEKRAEERRAKQEAEQEAKRLAEARALLDKHNQTRNARRFVVLDQDGDVIDVPDYDA